MADYYRKLLSNETDYLSERIAKYNKILEDNSEQMSEAVIGQIHLAIGQSNLFINERFRQFSGLIDDCVLKRGEKETTVEDLGGFWDMIFYQVEDLKTKYGLLEKLEQNGWVQPAIVAPSKSLKPMMVDNKANIIKNKRTVPPKISPPLKNGTNGASDNGISTTDGGVAAKKPAVRSNFREFLKNKRKEVTAPTNGTSVENGNSSVSNGSSAPALSNGTHHHLNGNSNKQQHSENGHTNNNNTVTNGHHAHSNGDSIESQKLKALTETMSRHSLTIDDTNKEN